MEGGVGERERAEGRADDGGGVTESSSHDEDRHRLTKLEEALEIKSLRRIVSAYLNYPDAAEQDVRRYERSYRKLPTSHKALLSHLPFKYLRLRWCIRENAYFITSMLQAFEPPFDMGQDLCYEDDNSGQCAGDCQHFESAKFDEKKLHSGQISLHSEDESLFEVQISTSSSFISEVQKTLRSNDTSNTQENVGKLQQLTEDDNQIPGTRCHEARNVASDGAEETCNGTVGCHPCDWWDPSLQLNVPLVDVDKVRCIIRNIVRDWAPEGQKERDQCYKPILEELVRLFPDRCKERIPSCLVPGAGLGRLALEISCLGFISQGNEFSYYMMICSSFILNQTRAVEEWTIYPWIHSNCNSFSDCDQFRPVSFPDILPGSAGITDGFSMCGGDFVEVYGNQKEKASWDAVVTCFFLDTAHNIVEYIEVISNVLKDGGVWINVGPLLYHFADTYNPEDEMSIELSLEDVKKVVLHYGFQIEVEKIIETTYTTNPLSMMQNHYLAAFWTMKKTVQN